MQADTVGTSLACPKAGESRQRGLTRRRGTAFVCASAFAGWRGGRRRGRRRRIPPRELVGHHGRAGLRVPRSCGAAPVLPAAHDARPLPHHQGACSCWLFAVVPVAVVVVVVGVFVGSSFFSRRFCFVSMSAHGFETSSFVSAGWRVTMVRLLKTLVDTLLSSLSDPLFCCFFVSNLSLSLSCLFLCVLCLSSFSLLQHAMIQECARTGCLKKNSIQRLSILDVGRLNKVGQEPEFGGEQPPPQRLVESKSLGKYEHYSSSRTT